MAVYVLTVAGSTKAIQEDSVDIRETANGRNLMNCAIKSLDGSYRPAIRAEVLLTEDGTRIFGGNIDAPSEQGIGRGANGSGNEILTNISVSDFNALADRRQVTEEIPAGTLKAALLVLEPYLTDYGVTLSGSQATGPSLPALSYVSRKLTEVFDELSALTDFEWTWNIDYNKSLRMVEIGTAAAPFNVTDSNRMVEGDITVEPNTTDYANYIIFLAGTGSHNIDFERHDGNGVTRTFVLDAPALALIGALRIDGGPGGFPVGIYGVDVMEWTFDAATNAIIQDPAYTVIAVGHYIEMSYTGQFPIRVTADGGSAPADLVEKTYSNDAIFDRTVAQALADALLVRDMATPKTVHYTTAQVGIHPGQTQTITSTKRSLSGDFVITDVQISTIAGHILRRHVTAVSGSTVPVSWRDTVKGWSGGSGAQSTAASVTIVSAGGVGGSGTSGTIPVWATSALLDDSVITQSGSVVTVAGTLVAPIYAGTTSVTGAWTFTSAPMISTTEPALYFNETDQGSNLKAIRFDLQGGVLQVQTLSDVFAVLTTTLTLSRAGALAVLGGITAGSGAVGIVDSTGKIPAISSTYFASLSGVNLTGVDLLGSVNTHTAFGTHTWSAGGAGGNRIDVANTTAGTGNFSRFTATNDVGITAMLAAYSSTFTTSGFTVANGVALEGARAGGLSLAASNASGDVRIYSRNALAATWGASQHLTVEASILPATNYVSNLGATATKFLQAHIAELVVETLVAQNTTATIGGRVLVAPTNILTADLAPAATTITVKYNNFTNGDRIRLEAEGKLEWMAVTSSAGGSAGVYTYTVTRNLDGTGADQWYAGDAALDTGTTGNGFIDIYSTAGVLSGTGPTIVGNVRTGTTYSNIAARWAIGNLDGLYGYSGSTYGAVFGDASATNVTVDATNGFRIRNSTTNKFVADTSGNLSIVGDLSVGTAGVIRSNATAFGTGTGYWLAYNAGTPQFRVGTTAGNRLSWDGTDFVLQSASVVIDSVGITLGTGAAISAYTPASALKFSRVTGLGFGQTGDHYGLYPVPTAGGANALFLENRVVGNTTTDSDASIQITAAGWDKDGGGVALADSKIVINSTSILTEIQLSTGNLIGLAAALVSLSGNVDLYSGRFRTGNDVDTTTYTQSNKNLLAGNSVEALGVSGSTTLVNLNMYVNTVAARKATIQAAIGGTNGGQFLVHVKPDSAGDVVEALRFSQTGALKLAAYTATTFAAGDKYLVVDASGNVHRSAIGPAS